MGFMDEYNRLKNKREGSKKTRSKSKKNYMEEYEALKAKRSPSSSLGERPNYTSTDSTSNKTDYTSYAMTVSERKNRLNNKLLNNHNKEKSISEYNVFDYGNLHKEIDTASADYKKRKTEKDNLETKIANMQMMVAPESEIEKEKKKLKNYSDLDEQKKDLDAKKQKYAYGTKQQTIKHLSSVVNNKDFKKYSQLGVPEYSSDLEDWYKHMTKEEKQIYNYYIGKGDKKSAKKFREALEETLNYRNAQKQFEDIEGNTALEILYGGKLGLQQFGQGMKNLGNMIIGNDEDVSKVATSEQMLAGMISEDLEDNSIPMWYNFKEGKWEDKILNRSTAQLGFDTLNTGANMIPSILASLGVSAVATPAAGAAVGATLMGGSAAGNAYQNGLADGMEEDEARAYGITIGALEGSLQYALGGIGSLSGTSAKLSKVASGIDNAALRFSVEYGGKISSEALEEGMQEVLDPLVKNAVDSDADEDVDWEEVAYSALMGAFMGGTMGGNVNTNTNTNIFTENEQKVIDKEIANRIEEAEKDGKTISKKEKSKIQDDVLRDLERGYISTDTIESVLGNETYNTYKSMEEQENSLREEIEALENTPENQFTVKQRERLTELREQLNNLDKTSVKEKLSSEVFELAKVDRLSESYNEKARRSQAFEADLTKYDAKQQEVIQKAIDSKILNNTNRTHEFVDMVAKISADKGVLFDFTNNQKLKESGFAVEGKTVNGYVKDGNIAVNIDSNKSLNSVVGHEITHILEGTELYSELQNVVKEYATTKGEYDTRFNELSEIYKGVEGADIESEITADLIGDYLFTDADFVNNLSVKNPNIFKKIYNEIKYLYKVATAGSKQARQLEKVKRTFEKAYKQNNANSNKESIEYSFDENTDISYESLVSKKDMNISKISITYDKVAKKNRTEIVKESLDKLSKTKDSNGVIKIYNDDTGMDIVIGKSGLEHGLNRNYEYTAMVSMNLESYLKNAIKVNEAIADEQRTHDSDILLGYGETTNGEKIPAYFVISKLTTGQTELIEFGSLYSIRAKKIAEDSTQGSSDFQVRTSATISISELLDIVNESYSDILPETVAKHYGIKRRETKLGKSVKYSLSDSNGKSLTKEQQEYFKDSKVRDENGNLKVMYHGSSEEFNVFDIKKAKSSGHYGRGFYFSDSESHAGQYGSAYEVYLNITNPVQAGTRNITKEQLRKFVEVVAENEDYGIENYGYGATVDSVTNSVYGKDDFGILVDINTTAIGDMVEAVKLFNEVNGTNYDGIIADTETVAFYPNQIKRVDNVAPTSSDDIRFSLSKNVEENKNLMAIHNLHTKELMKQLEMGGIPYPSVAVTRPDMIEHEGFGEISLILHKDTIDPKKSKYNKIYGADAYTPTFPQVDYEADRDVANKISEKVIALYDGIPEYYKRSLTAFRDYINIDERLNSVRGEQGLIERYVDDYGFKQLYLAEKGEVVPTEIKRTETEMSEWEKTAGQYIIEKLGKDVVAAYNRRDLSVSPMTVKRQWFEQYGEQFEDAYADLFVKDLNMSKEEARQIVDEQPASWQVKEMRKVSEYQKTGGIKVEEEEDLEATNNKIDEKINAKEYKQWLSNLFEGIEALSGIRNNKETFTANGNRRSFSALHDPVTIDNVIKAMRKKEQAGQGAFGTTNMNGASAQQYNSIAEVKQNADRLGVMDEEEHRNIRNEIDKRLYDIANRYSDGKDVIDAKDTLVEAVAKYENRSGIAKYLQQYDYVYKYDESIVDDIIALRDYIRSLPTPYFEAKPRRAVGFDEVAAFVIPYDTDAKLKQELLNRGYSIAEYDANVAGDRQRVLNQFEELKFSLSDNKDIAPVGNYNVYGKDIALQQDIAPVKETISKTNTFTDNYAPLTEAEANERDAQDRDRLYSLDEMDMPEEIEAPYSEPMTPDDPFADRNIEDMGDRKINAYMYENPEVKPFFQQEAEYMLGELNNSIKGEKSYNDQLYYESGGESGWFGTKRETSDEIAYLLDNFKYTYADIEKGLKAIIEDNGKENNAISKRIEFMLDERLRLGYSDFISGEQIPANQDYINLLNEKQITDYSDEAWNNWLQSFAPENTAPVTEDIAPIKEYEAIKPRPDKLSAVEEQWAKNKMTRADKVKGETEHQEIARVLDEEPKTESQRNNRKWAIFKANVLDKGAVFEDLSLKSKNRNLMGKWNYTLYSEAKAQRLMGNGSDGVKSLNEIREEVGNTGLTKQFYEYMYHKHNVDRMSLEGKYEDVKNKPVFGDSVTAEVSQKVVDQYEAANPEFKEFAKDVYDYMTYLRNQLVDNGVISQETADLWQKMYPHYVPTRRVNERGLDINVPLDTGRTSVNAPIKKATGGSSDILPLFDTMASRTLQTFKATAKNSFGVELKNTLGTTIENTATNIDEVIDSIDTQESLLQEGKNGQRPTFTVFENGEKVTFEITEDMYDALKPVSNSSLLSKTITPLNVASNIHRGLLTEYNPVFMLTNAIKDSQDVLINSQHPVKTYSKIPEANMQVLTKGYWYNEYMANGGEQNSYFDNESNTFKTENKGIKKLLDLPPFSTISKLNNHIEVIPRLAEYIASREAGRSIEVSMLDAARVTTNFRAGGDLTKFINRNGGTFLNASVQGAMQQIRNVREAKANGLKGWVNLATKFAIAGLPTVILNNFVWEDDEEYDELSDYVKQNYYVVGKYGDGKFIRIPKGRTLAVIQEAIQQISNAATGNDEADLKSFLDLAVSNLAPNNPLENNILAPISQVLKNETWYGEDLVPSRLADLPAKEQFDESTDLLSKWLGEKLDIAPVKINYLLDQYTGGVGDVVLPMLTPEAESGDNSLVGNMIAPLKGKFTTDSVINNQNVSDFYDTSDTLTTNAKKSDATDTDVLKNKYFNSVKGEMAELYGKKREIQNSNLSDKVKYEQVRNIQSQIDELSKKALGEYEDVDIDNGYATVGDRQFRLTDEGEWTKISDKQLEKQNKVTSFLDIKPSEYWSNKEEYDYAYEYPEKYNFLKENNMSYKDYTNADEETKDAYTWAYNNPEKFTVSKAVADDVVTYRSYTKDLYEIKADKDENGKSISGSRKEKVLDYINSLDADYGAKLILFKSEYNSDDTYNYEIIDYLNSREDITYEEMNTILTELGFRVDSKGNISWD